MTDIRRSMQEAEKLVQLLQDELDRTNKGLILLTLELEESIDKYRSIFVNANEGILQYSLAGEILLANPAMASILEYQSVEELYQMITNVNQQIFVHPDTRNRDILPIIQERGFISRYVSQVYCKTKKIKFLSENSHFLDDSNNNPTGFEGIYEDITAQKLVHDALIESEKKFHMISDILPKALVLLDKNDVIEEWNPAAELIFGWSRTEMLKKPLFEMLFSEDLKDNARIQILNQVQYQKGKPLILQCYTKEKKSIICEWYGAILKDNQGDISKKLLIAVDITDQVKKEQIIAQNSKMDAIGALVGGIAHDFNNILNILNGYAELALIKFEDPSFVKESLDQIINMGKRAAKLTHELMTFSRFRPITATTLHINPLIKAIHKNLLRPAIGENIDLILVLSEDFYAILIDPSQVEQILINLVVNARDAILERNDHAFQGQITIRTQNFEIDETFAQCHLTRTMGKHILLEVEDNGIGMSDATRVHIFEPFFTTKKEGKGTGLGLTSVYGIVNQNNGSIYVYSEVGVGTIFKIYFPSVEQIIDRPMQEIDEFSDYNGTGTIFFVDDEIALREMMSQALRIFGYTVFEAANGELALEMIKNMTERIDLLITDINMPQKGGIELARNVVDIKPHIRIIFISGYSTPKMDYFENPDNVYFLSKPFSVKDLTKKIRFLLQ